MFSDVLRVHPAMKRSCSFMLFTWAFFVFLLPLCFLDQQTDGKWDFLPFPLFYFQLRFPLVFQRYCCSQILVCFCWVWCNVVKASFKLQQGATWEKRLGCWPEKKLCWILAAVSGWKSWAPRFPGTTFHSKRNWSSKDFILQ